MKMIVSLPKMVTVYDSIPNDEDAHDCESSEEEEEKKLTQHLLESSSENDHNIGDLPVPVAANIKIGNL